MNEAIAVEARFEADGIIRPLAFMWQGKRYQVASLGRHWKQDGEHRFLVMTHGEQIYELAYLIAEASWRLRRCPKDFRISGLAV